MADEIGIKMVSMSILRKPAMAVLLLGLTASWASAQHRPPDRKSAETSAVHTPKILNKRERKTVVAVALASKRPHHAERDCSHLVHGIYERAGFPYQYADSDELYSGVEGFQRVSKPQSADLVVWHGHVGIVTRPSRHEFFSFLSKGPGLNNYRSRYWKSRGQPRFYRFVKNDPCAGCALARGNGE